MAVVHDVVQREENTAITVAVDWLQLPEHVITCFIFSKLCSIFDYARFGHVCLQWRSIFREQYYCAKSSLPPQPPLLVIPTPPEMMTKKKKKKNKKKKHDTSTISCSFFRVADGKIFNRLKLTVPHHRQFRGCGFGWLITVDEELCHSIQLVNPFFYPNTATKEIKLPPLTTFSSEIIDPDYYIHYALLKNPVLSADPASNPKDCVVMAIFGRFKRLSFCRPGDKAWTPMIVNSFYQYFYDLIYYQGNFYALDINGAVLVCNVTTRTTTTFAEPPVPSISSSRKYLVISEGGELFQVNRYCDGGGKYSNRFIVLKFQRKSETSTYWVEVKDLNDRAFFIGDSPSMSISSSDFPGCKPNCIYYTDDRVDYHYWAYNHMREEGPCDLGVFNVGNGKFEKHYVSDVALWPAPIWIQPMLIPSRSIARSKKKHYC